MLVSMVQVNHHMYRTDLHFDGLVPRTFMTRLAILTFGVRPIMAFTEVLSIGGGSVALG